MSPGTQTCAAPECPRAVYARGWCGMHYKRWLRTGSPIRGERPPTCAVESCERQAKSRGWCHAHYQRWRHHGDVRPDVPLRAARNCEVKGCDRPSHARELCQAHYRRLLQSGDARPLEPVRMVTGEGSLSHGYWKVPISPGERWLTNGQAVALEHRLVVARRLGRPLWDDEVVHHLNGDRTDNRPENLELWSTAQPKGQRIPDKVAYSLERLRRYRPDLLAEHAERPLPK